MKRLAIFIIFIGLCIKVQAQKCDAVLGTWLSATKEGHILMYKRGNKYYGKLNWIILPKDASGKLQTDKMNVHPELKKRQLLNLEIVKDFVCDGDTYKNGTIYDPKRGKAFNCKLSVSGNILTVKGYIGMIPVHTEKWTRIK